jgi:geranylgeranyl pyrophosphate synthase
MLSPRQGDASYITRVCDLIESVLGESLTEGPLFEAIEAILQTLKGEEAKSSFAFLPIWTCQAAEGDPHQAVTVSAAWCVLHTAALLLDDVEDGELDRKPWPPMTPSQAINVATALTSVAQLLLGCMGRWGVTDSLALALSQAVNQAFLQVCAGQHLDLAATLSSLEGYWRMAAGKSGGCFAVACRAGAMVAGADSAQIARYAEFGRQLGILVQISDDFNGTWNSPGPGDLVPGSKSLPVIYALSVGSPETQAQFLDLLPRARTSEAALAEARQMLIDLGALHYMVVQAETHRRRAQEALPLPGQDRDAYDQLVALLNRVMPAPRPVG